MSERYGIETIDEIVLKFLKYQADKNHNIFDAMEFIEKFGVDWSYFYYEEEVL